MNLVKILLQFMAENEKLTMPDQIMTTRLLIQRLDLQDAEAMYYVYASKPEATKYVSFPTHNSITDARKYLAYARAAWNMGRDYSYAIRLQSDNRLIGSIGVINDAGKCNFGYILGPAYWGKGFATEAASAILNVLKNQPGVFRIWSVCDVENEASKRVLEKAGLKLEASLEKWMRFPNQNNEPKDCLMYRYEL